MRIVALSLRNLCMILIWLLIQQHPVSAGQPTLKEVENLPFVKAFAYALARQEFCFAERIENFDTLALAALEQETLAQVSIMDASKRAAAHLRSDQSACGPALKFVDDAVSRLAEGRTLMSELRAARHLAEMEVCTRLVNDARQRQEEGQTISATAPALSDCNDKLSTDPAYSMTARQAQAVLDAERKSETLRRAKEAARAASERLKRHEEERQRREAREREQERREAQEDEKRKSFRDRLELRVNETNRANGREYTAPEFCAYTISPEDGSIVMEYTRQAIADVHLCIDALDPVTEVDWLNFVKNAVDRSPSSFQR